MDAEKTIKDSQPLNYSLTTIPPLQYGSQTLYSKSNKDMQSYFPVEDMDTISLADAYYLN